MSCESLVSLEPAKVLISQLAKSVYKVKVANEEAKEVLSVAQHLAQRNITMYVNNDMI